MIFTSLYTNPWWCPLRCSRKDTERSGEVSLMEWNSQAFCNNCVINIPMNYSAVSCECFHTPGCRCLPLVSCHRGKLSTQRHATVSSHTATNVPNFLSVLVCFGGGASRTYSVAVVLHFFPVPQVHGPDVAIEQAFGVRDCVRPCTAKKGHYFSWRL